MRSLSPQKQRSFLFLQGPPGPFFAILGAELRALGCAIHRINLNGGDVYDWPEPATDYLDTLDRWPIFLDAFFAEKGITDLILYGDCRPVHTAALGIAKHHNIAAHVLEEGYIRPDWMTLEPDGVNAHSSLPRDPQWMLKEARILPPLPDLPPITASFGRRAHDSYWHYHHIVTGRLKFRHYRPHRPYVIIIEGFGWLYRFRIAKARAEAARRTLEQIANQPYYLLPLQLTADYQIRAHSPFTNMKSALEFAVRSFAAHAPPASRLLIKEHPLDCTFFSWPRYIAKLARKYDCVGRLMHIEGGDLEQLSRQSRGMVCVNSTSGTLALASGTPTKVLGDAVYDLPGLTYQGSLDDFWTQGTRPDRAIFEAFRRVLHDRCLVRGGLASRSAIQILVRSTLDRLMHDPRHASGSFSGVDQSRLKTVEEATKPFAGIRQQRA